MSRLDANESARAMIFIRLCKTSYFHFVVIWDDAKFLISIIDYTERRD